jgi:hypothetical protein
MSVPAAAAYRPVPREVVFEVVEGEVILIQLNRGTYFSLSGSGELLWGLLVAGVAVDEIVAALTAAADDGLDSQVEADVGELVGRMLEEGLIEIVGESAAPAADRPEIPDDFTYQAAVLERYDDMQDFLALDPIHEVAEAGWPEAKPDS